MSQMPIFSRGITGYGFDKPIHELGLLQHYFEISPVLDLTSDPNVALYFALQGCDPSLQQVIYALDKSNLVADGLVVSDHDLLLRPIKEHGYRCRWIRQSGFVIGRRSWQSISSTDPFNLLDHNHYAAYFKAAEADKQAIANMPDLLAVEDDAIAENVFNFFHMICDHLRISKLFSYELHKYGFDSPVARKNRELDDLEQKAIQKRDKWSIKEIRRMRTANNKRHWEVAWEALFDVVKQKLV